MTEKASFIDQLLVECVGLNTQKTTVDHGNEHPFSKETVFVQRYSVKQGDLCQSIAIIDGLL